MYRERERLYFIVGLGLAVPQQDDHLLGRPSLYTTTTQRGCFIEVVVSILVQSQSQESLPGGGGA